MWFQVRNHGRRMSLWSLQLGEIFTAKKTRWNSMEFLVCGWKYCEQNEMLSRCGSKMVCGFKAGFVLSFLKCLFHNVISEWAVCCWPLETYRFCRKARKRHSGKPHLWSVSYFSLKRTRGLQDSWIPSLHASVFWSHPQHAGENSWKVCSFEIFQSSW